MKLKRMTKQKSTTIVHHKNIIFPPFFIPNNAQIEYVHLGPNWYPQYYRNVTCQDQHLQGGRRCMKGFQCTAIIYPVSIWCDAMRWPAPHLTMLCIFRLIWTNMHANIFDRHRCLCSHIIQWKHSHFRPYLSNQSTRFQIKLLRRKHAATHSRTDNEAASQMPEEFRKCWKETIVNAVAGCVCSPPP